MPWRWGLVTWRRAVGRTHPVRRVAMPMAIADLPVESVVTDAATLVSLERGARVGTVATVALSAPLPCGDVRLHKATSRIGEYEGVWRMAYVRGPEGIIVSLAEHIEK